MAGLSLIEVRPRKRSAAEWRALVRAYAKRTGTAPEFCREHGVAVSTLDWWRRRLEKAYGSSAIRSKGRPVSAARPLSFIELPAVPGAARVPWVEDRPERAVWRERLGWWPVPLLAVVVFLIAGAQVGTVLDAGPVLLTVLPVFVGFLLVAAMLALGLTRWLRLPIDAGRTLAFSLGTRNSFVALALPAGWETTVVVVVFQSLVELFGMVFYLWWLPRHLFEQPRN